MSLDLTALRTAAQQNPNFPRVLAAIAKCQPRLNVVSIPAIYRQATRRNDNRLEREEVLTVLRLCEQVGAGLVLDAGSRTRGRFAWKVRPASFVAAVLEPTSSLVASDFYNPADIPLNPAREVPPPPGWLRYKFPLREGLEIALDLPADLTDREAKQLSHFLQAAARRS